MDIIVKGRHTGVSDRFRDHVSTKLARIERLDNKLIRVDVEVCKERNPRMSDQRERVELTIHSRGPAIRAEASAVDRFAALDMALGKLESRLRRVSDRRKIHHGSQCPPSVSEITAALTTLDDIRLAEGEPAFQPEPGQPHVPASDTRNNGVRTGSVPTDSAQRAGERKGRRDSEDDEDDYASPLVAIEMDGDGPLVVREKGHAADPMTIDQALLEMELVGHDFYLFRDKESGLPSVVYRRRGYHYGVLRLLET